MNKRYKIVWADDDIYSLCPQKVSDYLQTKDIDVLERFPNAKLLRDFLVTAKPGTIDAVIVDANFPYESFKPDRERDTMGLQKVAQWVENPQFDYPFILYTGRNDLISGDDSDLFEYFTSNHYVVYKDVIKGIPNLIAKIKETVDRRNSTEGIILEQFHKELECAKVFDKICKGHAFPLLLELLVKSHDNTLEDPERCLNDIRAEIMDKMVNKATDYHIVPGGLSLNDFSRLLCIGKLKISETAESTTTVSLKEEVLPSGLALGMEYIVKTTQDGSHYGDSLKYQVRQYVGDTENVNIIRSILFIVLELIKWFMMYLANHTDAQANQDNLIFEISEH